MYNQQLHSTQYLGYGVFGYAHSWFWFIALIPPPSSPTKRISLTSLRPYPFPCLIQLCSLNLSLYRVNCKKSAMKYGYVVGILCNHNWDPVSYVSFQVTVAKSYEDSEKQNLIYEDINPWPLVVEIFDQSCGHSVTRHNVSSVPSKLLVDFVACCWKTNLLLESYK